MELTLQDLIDVINKEVTFGFHYTAEGGSKKITYNTYDLTTRIYHNGVLVYENQFADNAINFYNNIY